MFRTVGQDKCLFQQPLVVNSIGELNKLESQILARIHETPYGSLLYVLHPLMLLEDLGIYLSQELVEKLKHHWPRLNHPDADQAPGLLNLDSMAGAQIKITRLFGRETLGPEAA